MSDATSIDTPLWSTETVRKLITILLPDRGEKFDRWYAHEINKAYQRGYDSYKEFFEAADPYERYQYLMTTTEILPKVIDQDNMELFDSPGAREHVWQDRDGDYWCWAKGRNSWEWSTFITSAYAGFGHRSQVIRHRPYVDAAPFARVLRVS